MAACRSRSRGSEIAMKAYRRRAGSDKETVSKIRVVVRD
jgi:hypothetical protein